MEKQVFSWPLEMSARSPSVSASYSRVLLSASSSAIALDERSQGSPAVEWPNGTWTCTNVSRARSALNHVMLSSFSHELSPHIGRRAHVCGRVGRFGTLHRSDAARDLLCRRNLGRRRAVHRHLVAGVDGRTRPA